MSFIHLPTLFGSQYLLPGILIVVLLLVLLLLFSSRRRAKAERASLAPAQEAESPAPDQPDELQPATAPTMSVHAPMPAVVTQPVAVFTQPVGMAGVQSAMAQPQPTMMAPQPRNTRFRRRSTIPSSRGGRREGLVARRARGQPRAQAQGAGGDGEARVDRGRGGESARVRDVEVLAFHRHA